MSHFEELARRLTRRAPKPAAERQAVVSMLVRGTPGQLEVLLMKRIEHAADPWSGQISLPGGHVDEGDADLLSSALRETREEVNLDLDLHARWLGCLPTLQASRRGLPIQLAITPFVFEGQGPLEPEPGPEAQEVFWFPLSAAGAGRLDITHRVEFRGKERPMPGWRHDGHIVWGLTHRMLRDLLERLSAPS